MIRKECPKCHSKDLSDGKSDFIFCMESGEVPIQFCNKCHEEWFVKDGGKVRE